MIRGMTRWGILSTARITAAALIDAGAQVAAVASRDRERGEAFAARHGIERVHDSYQQLIDDPDVDAIYNPLPNSLHLPWSVRALEAGKHVLCEKPLGRRAADVAAAFDAAARSDRVLAEAFFWRYHPQVEIAIDLLASGAVGRPLLVRSSCGFPLSDLDDIRMQTDLEGGSLMDVGCYCVHGARNLLRVEPSRVYAEQSLDGAHGVDMTTVGILRFPSDALTTFDCSFVTPDRSELEVVGDDGTLIFSDPWPDPAVTRPASIELRRPDGVETIAVPNADAYALQLAHVEASFRGEVRPLCDRVDAVGQARAIEALYESADRGVSVAI